MFDLFGLKAKRYMKELEREVDYLAVKNRKLKKQIETVRMMANQMRDRVRSHGATELERNFLDVCMNAHSHGKMISTMQFHHMLELAKKERDSLAQVVGAGQ
ncbi:hypothetical protein ACSLOU_00630 [Enterobacter cloacae]|uniref:hypothetical protein n=1 Tax=Enterobacter cloacae TaxID=550 RepID=UPI003EE42308